MSVFTILLSEGLLGRHSPSWQDCLEKSVTRKDMLPISPIIVSKASLSISAIIIDAERVILDYKFIQNRIH
jgi:hypothetical protein